MRRSLSPVERNTSPVEVSSSPLAVHPVIGGEDDAASQPASTKTAAQLAAEAALTATENAATAERLAREAAAAAQPAGYTALPVADANDGGSDDENNVPDANANPSRATAAFHSLLSLPYEVTRALWRHPKTALYCAAVATVIALEVMGCKGGLGKRSEEECYNVGLAFGNEKREGIAPASNSTSEIPAPDVIPSMPTVNTFTKAMLPVLTTATAASVYAFFKYCCASRRSSDGYRPLRVNVERPIEPTA